MMKDLNRLIMMGKGNLIPINRFLCDKHNIDCIKNFYGVGTEIDITNGEVTATVYNSDNKLETEIVLTNAYIEYDRELQKIIKIELGK